MHFGYMANQGDALVQPEIPYLVLVAIGGTKCGMRPAVDKIEFPNNRQKTRKNAELHPGLMFSAVDICSVHIDSPKALL
jgi:hypothetical protein